MGNYTNGLADGMAARNAAVREYGSAIGEWKTYASKLNGQLSEAEKRTVFVGAQLNGQTELARRLLDELRRMAPDSPLLNENVRLRIQQDGMAKYLAQQGYEYDADRNRVIKR